MIETSNRLVAQERLTPPAVMQVAVPVSPKPATAARPGVGSEILQAALLFPVVAFAALLILFSLVPAAFVGLVLFLPALAPFFLVVLVILATSDLNARQERQLSLADASSQQGAEDRLCDPNQPCCCGLHGEKPESASLAFHP